LTKLASVFFGETRSDARLEPAFPALSIHAAPRTSTRADACEHGAVSDETNIKCIRDILPCRLTIYLAVIAAYQARGHLHVALAYGAQSGRTKKREAFTGAPLQMP
jgi:hypothetical protein